VNFAFGVMIGQLMGWLFRQIVKVWWIFAGLFGGSVVGQLLDWVKVPQVIIIPVSWITAVLIMVYLRQRSKEKKWLQGRR
jgi:hypothetical protein